jgi:hypothetical protein
MGTIDLTGRPLPALFEPKVTRVEIDFNYNQEIFQNDIFIYILFKIFILYSLKMKISN